MAKKNRTVVRRGQLDKDGLLKGAGATISVRRVLPSELVALFSDQFVISHTENEYILSFLQTQIPLAVTKEEFAKVKMIDAVCVARIIATPAQLEKIRDAISKNLERGPKPSKEKLEKENGNKGE